MKKIIIFTILFLVFLQSNSNSYAQKTSKTPTPTSIDISDQIDELKSKIASKVAQLNLVEKRGFYGTVTDASDTQITLSTVNGETRFVDVDELTKFSSDSNDSFGISDIKKSMSLGVIGLFNKQSQRMQARVVEEEDALPNFFYGAVYSVDSEEFTLTIAKENGARNVIDVESITKSYLFIDGELVKSGFSKIKETTPVVVVGFPGKDNKNITLGLRIFLFPEISPSAKINLNPSQEDVTPSTGSGKKLVPIVK